MFETRLILLWKAEVSSVRGSDFNHRYRTPLGDSNNVFSQVE